MSFLLGYDPPYHWGAMLEFFGNRAIDAVENCGERRYERTFEIHGRTGHVATTVDHANNALVVRARALGPAATPAIEKRIRAMDLGEQEQAIFKIVANVAFIDVQGVRGLTGHSYYLDNPSTSSDIIRVINTGSPGRPLTHRMLNFWEMPVDYPGASD